MDEEDPRQVELSILTAIYPELHVDEQDSHTVSIELPVSLTNPLTVLFPAASEAKPTLEPPAATASSVVNVDSQSLSHLPSLQLRITLPEGYPEKRPPQVVISTSPPWLPRDILQKLAHDAERLWEDIGRDQVVFAYIDDVQQSTDNVFGLVDGEGTLEVAPEHKIAILDYDIKAKRKAFEKETFICGICLDPKKGSTCHRMLDCGHVFCVQCLQDFYNNAITEGDVASVQCLEPKCAHEREKRETTPGPSSKKQRKAKTFISPSELLQIPLDQDMVKRYVALKYKNELESDKNTIYCPRPWCQGAARSKKHKKPEGLDFAQDSGEESDVDELSEKAEEASKKNFDANKELLSICDDCSFAFCSRCGQSWHGEFKYCSPKERTSEVTEEEVASLEYLKMHTTPCPTCAAPSQKTMGCNHMRCFRCQTHFCYLCSAWLDPANPYKHFNTQPNGEVTSCFMRLWELEGGDGDDIGIGFAGGDAMPHANGQAGEYGQHLEILARAGDEHHEDEPNAAVPAEEAAAPQVQGQGEDQAQQQQRGPQANGRAAVAREGPLVLRIEGGPPAPQRAPAPVAVGRGGRGGAAANRGGRGAGRGGRGNRRGGGGPGPAPRLNRPNNRVQMQQQGQNQRPHNNNALNRQGIGDILRQEGELDPNQAAWIRQFVQLALADQEDLADDDEL